MLLLRGLALRYDALLRSDPYKTKAIGTGVTYVFSDLTAQAIEAQRSSLAPAVAPHDRAARALKFGAVGVFWIGPVLTAWFDAMDRLVPGRAARPLLAKLLLDQCAMAPPLLASMFVVTALTNDVAPAAIRAKLEHHLIPTWQNSVAVWAPVSLFQLAVVPLPYRVAVSNVVSYFWDTYLSMKMMHTASPVSAPGGLQRAMTQGRLHHPR